MGECLPSVTVDISSFVPGNSIDTCAIWNLLSSPCLTRAAGARQCWFVLASYVRYEALDRPRSRSTLGERAMQEELRELLARQQKFREVSLSVDDLAAVAALGDVRRLGRGEIAAMALALKMRCALMTDDQPARRHASRVGVQTVQTTPHLLGWLHVEGEIGDTEVTTIISEHENRIPADRGPISKFFKAVWYEACRIRLMAASVAARAVGAKSD